MKRIGRRVLVAEDDAVFRRVIEFTLSRAGFSVTTAINGADALAQFQEVQIDCLVTDQQMPQLSGIELVDRIRRVDVYKDIPIILCTAKGLELDSQFLMERYGLRAVLHKPFSPRHLISLLESCCGTKKQSLSTQN